MSRLLGTHTVDRKRFNPPTYSGGRYVEGVSTLTTGICAAVQSPRSDSLFIENLIQNIEGKRVREVIIVFCPKDSFRGADDRNNTPADVIIYNGNEYEVQKIEHRKGIQLKHDKVFAVRLET